jgi:hypothetical protein
MGYCHYWYRKEEINEEVFGRIRFDFERILLPLEDAGVPLASPLGIGVPEIGPSRIAFNGLKNCDHAGNKSIEIPFPSNNASGIGDSRTAVAESGVFGVRLRHRSCSGTCSYEAFILGQDIKSRRRRPDPDGQYLCDCKTAFRPYDLAGAMYPTHLQTPSQRPIQGQIRRIGSPVERAPSVLLRTPRLLTQ